MLNGTTTTHTYGSDGLRRRTVEGATTADYVLDGQSVVRTLVNNGVDRTYLHGARGPEYERIGANNPVWYLYDGLGSVLGTVDKNGTVVSTRPRPLSPGFSPVLLLGLWEGSEKISFNFLSRSHSLG